MYSTDIKTPALRHAAYLVLNASECEKCCSESSSIRNFIFSKNEAVAAGGCFLRSSSMGDEARDTHNCEPLQARWSQHSGSSQSTRPSVGGGRAWRGTNRHGGTNSA